VFTGLIRECAEVLDFRDNVLTLRAKHKPKIGDSVCVNGACLTVIYAEKGVFKVELSHESLDVLAVENLKGKVHIEPSLALGDKLEGHLVQGHIDGVGQIVKIEIKKSGADFYIKIPKNLRVFMAAKGSVAIDGISLTINEVVNDDIRLTIISHTIKETLFHTYKIGRFVNVESDMIARYLYRLNQKKDDDWAFIDKMTALY
jgi:riboflavin synthase